MKRNLVSAIGLTASLVAVFLVVTTAAQPLMMAAGCTVDCVCKDKTTGVISSVHSTWLTTDTACGNLSGGQGSTQCPTTPTNIDNQCVKACKNRLNMEYSSCNLIPTPKPKP